MFGLCHRLGNTADDCLDRPVFAQQLCQITAAALHDGLLRSFDQLAEREGPSLGTDG
jgi:hypothetical protein